MFSNVRVNQQIFVLDKANGVFDVGTVCEEPKTRFSQQQPQNNQYGYPMTMPPVQVVDLMIQTPTGRVPVQGLPMDKNFYDNQTKTLFVTEDKQLMLNELKTVKEQSEAHVKRTPFCQEMIGKCDRWVEMLDPEAAEKKRLADELASMKNAYAEQTKINQQVIEQLQALAKQNEMLMAQRNEDKSVKPVKTKENA